MKMTKEENKTKKELLNQNTNRAYLINDDEEENKSNHKELKLKSVTLYEPLTYAQIININKKKYKNLLINKLTVHLENTLNELDEAIEIYSQLRNRTEFWENKNTFEFDFKSWNTIKKVTGHITRYYNDILNLKQNIEKIGKEKK